MVTFNVIRWMDAWARVQSRDLVLRMYVSGLGAGCSCYGLGVSTGYRFVVYVGELIHGCSYLLIVGVGVWD